MIPIDQIKIIVKLVACGFIILGSILYVYHLKSEIQMHETTIAELNGKLELSNQAVIIQGIASKTLQKRLDVISITKNKPIVVEADKTKNIIENRPISTTCEDAVFNLEKTAKSVAHDWNAK